MSGKPPGTELLGIQIHLLNGYIGTILYSGFMLPQIYKTWRTKSTNDLSVYMLWLHVVAISCMFYYGYHVRSFQVMVANIMCIIQTFALLYMVHKYSHKKHLYATHL
jgi:MtN3 and saliva related transmembrane protein